MINGICAIVGRPNVGKSTIFNRIIGERKSIVEDTPGVTRDRIYGKVEWLTKEFRVIDTGGIQLADQPFQKEIEMQVEIAIDEADSMVNMDIETDIQGYDIDDKMVSIARENAKLAGVENLIHFQRRGVEQLSHPKKYGFIITNPPYGERIEEKKNLPALYRTIGERYMGLDSWSMYMISAYEQAEQYIGRKADKNRKIYNGMMKTYYYQFMGPKPPSGENRRHGG